MRPMHFKFCGMPSGGTWIICGIAMLLLFFFSWRALLAFAGCAMIFAGCSRLIRKH